MISHLCQLNQLVKSLKTPLMNSKKTTWNPPTPIFQCIFLWPNFEPQKIHHVQPLDPSGSHLAKPSDALEVLLGRAVADHGDVLRHIGPAEIFRGDPTVMSRWFHGDLTVIVHGDPMVIEWWWYGSNGDFPWWFSMVIIWWLYDIIWWFYGDLLWDGALDCRIFICRILNSLWETGDATSTHFRFLIGDEGWILGIPRFNPSFARTVSDLELLTI